MKFASFPSGGRGAAARRALVAGLGLLCLLGSAAQAGAPFDLAGMLRPSVMAFPTPPALLPPGGEPWYLAPLTIRNGLLILHLVGLSIGFGSTIILDYHLLRWIALGRLADGFDTLIRFLGASVAVGLALLWASGLGFLFLYAATDPAKLDNAKLYGKIAIVCALTVNGVALHRFIMPMTLGDLSAPLFSRLDARARLIALACGAVSGTSWVAAFLLGLMRELNGRVAVSEIVGVWLLMVLGAFSAASLLVQARIGPVGASGRPGRLAFGA